MERSQVRKAILQLKEDYQRVVVLRFIMGMNCSEVAAIMGKREGTIRVIQHRALLALRSILEEGE
jgi:RNA polymerase sigma-70 factor (ECF subfamily)